MADTVGSLAARYWWALALRGVLGAIVGLIALFFPDVTLAALVLLFAAYMLVDGVLAIAAGVQAARRHERSWPLFLEGVVDVAAGLIAFFWPAITLLVLVYVIGFWAILSGLLMIAAALRPPNRHEWLLALAGVLSVIFGSLLLIAPVAGAVVLAWWFGAYAFAFGIVLLILAFRLRRRAGHPQVMAGTV
jgi:uncharacterized membrane protein HdeD (DUF308 family)